MSYTDEELFGHEQPYRDGGIELGTVGWDDGGEHYELGTDDNDGHTLVKVTLFRGRRPDEAQKDPTRAQGLQLLCRISAPLWFIPEDGAQVLVAIPAGHALTPGAPMIIAAPGKNPTKQFAGNGGKDAILDFGPDRRVIIKAGKGVILSDYDNNWFGVRPTFGIKGGLKEGDGIHLKHGKFQAWIAKGNGDMAAILEMNETKVDLALAAGTSAVRLEPDKAWLIAPLATYLYSAGVYLGATASATSQALYMLAGTPTPSASVFVSV